MTQDIVKSGPQDLTVAEASVEQEVVGSDVLIPRLLLMQGISPLVTSRKAQLGDIVRNSTGEKLGNPDQPVDIVPIKLANTWAHYEVLGTKPEFRSTEPRTAANGDLPWEYEKNGTKWLRKKVISLFALIPDDVKAYEAEIARAVENGEAPDLGKTVMPVVITFQSTSFKYAGRKCSTFFNTVQVNARRFPALKLTPYSYVLPLLCREEKNNKGTFFVFDLGPSRSLKDDEVKQTAARWAADLSRGSIRTDDSGEVAESSDDGDVTEV